MGSDVLFLLLSMRPVVILQLASPRLSQLIFAHIIKVENYYAAYNRAKLYNRQTQEKKDLVTVVVDLG
jgi:hypothetical protein